MNGRDHLFVGIREGQPLKHYCEMRADLPKGNVTFLFTDVEGSTKLLHELGDESYSEALGEHRRAIRAALANHHGVEVDTQGDAFFIAFPSATGAVEAVEEILRGLAGGPIRIRAGLHMGKPHVTAEGYVGEVVHKGARIAAVGHGGQVLLSRELRDVLDVECTDLGEHRLKDFNEPVWIYQLGSERFPPLKTISNSNLPRPASSLVGRERERKEIVSMLRDGARLVTLVGPGGSGKTRLGIEVGTELILDFRNGVFWVDLAPVRDASLVVRTIAETLGATDDLLGYVGEREMLLVLDNLEQVIDSASDLSPLLSACPNLRMLVTSRELLRINGENEYAVPPLSDVEAKQLFYARSGIQSDDLVDELCRRLDNLPLAVELAAARAKVLSPHQILERLGQRLDILKGGRDSDERQRTLRATIAWSFELLDADERLLFARLSVFRGGCDLDAAEQVADANLDTLQSLVDKSLVRFGSGRFSMLETIREFAHEQLGDDDAAATSRRHAEYYLALAEKAEVPIRERSKEWLDRMALELDNLRAALDELEAAGDVQGVLRLLGAAGELWGVRGHFAEVIGRVGRALELDPAPTPARLSALVLAADNADGHGAAIAGQRAAEEALSLSRQLGARWYEAAALSALAGIAADEARWEEGRDLLLESEMIFRDLGDEFQAVLASRFAAWMTSELGEHARALEMNEANLDRARALGNPYVEAHVLEAVAFAWVRQGRASDALPLIERAYSINVQLDDLFRIAIDVRRFAVILAETGQIEAAVSVLACSEALLEDLGTKPAWPERWKEDVTEKARMVLSDAEFDDAWKKGVRMTNEAAVKLTRAALAVAPQSP